MSESQSNSSPVPAIDTNDIPPPPPPVIDESEEQEIPCINNPNNPSHHPPELIIADELESAIPISSPSLPSPLGESHSEPGQCQSPIDYNNGEINFIEAENEIRFSYEEFAAPAPNNDVNNTNDTNDKDVSQFFESSLLSFSQSLPVIPFNEINNESQRFSIVIDNTEAKAPMTPMQAVEEEEKDFSESFNASVNDSPIDEPGRSLPSVSFNDSIYHHQPLTPLSDAFHHQSSQRSFSFSYDTNSEEEEESKSLMRLENSRISQQFVSPPLKQLINERYNVPENDFGCRGSVNIDEEEKEEKISDNFSFHSNPTTNHINISNIDTADNDDDDINVVHHYHTVRNPDSSESVHFVSNPLLGHVINIEPHQTAEGETLNEAMARQKAIIQAKIIQAKEKAERKAKREEKRRRKEEKKAAAREKAEQQGEENLNEAIVRVHDPESPNRESVNLQPSLASPKARDLSMIELQSPSPMPLSPAAILSPFPISPTPETPKFRAPPLTIDVAGSKGEMEFDEDSVPDLPITANPMARLNKFHHSESLPTTPSHSGHALNSPVIAKPRHMVKAEEKRPAKLNLPSRSKDDANHTNNKIIEKKLSASGASSVQMKSRRLGGNEIKSPETPAKHLSPIANSPTPANNNNNNNNDSNSNNDKPPQSPAPKLSLKQLVSVSWLPKDPMFPTSKQAKYEEYRSKAYDKEIHHQMPAHNDHIDIINDRISRLSSKGPNDDRRVSWMASQSQSVIDNHENIPHRFIVESMIDQHHKLSPHGSAERLVGRDNLIRISDSGQSFLYHELVLIDDSKSIDKVLIDALNTFVNCHHLIINDTKIIQTRLMMPNLLSMTLSNNKIASMATLTHLTLHTPLLSSLTIINNPINDKIPMTGPNGLPPIDHEIWRLLILPLQSLMWFNGIKIDNLTRFSAYQFIKSNKLFSSVSLSLWYSAIDYEPTISSMNGWKFNEIESLTLSHLSLLAANLFSFSQCQKLSKLDLSHNHLTSISHSGIQSLTFLQHLDLSDNELLTLNDLNILGQCQSLQSVILTGNDNLKDYKSHVIYHCRYLIGLESSSGLQSLDGNLLTIEEKIRHYAQFDKNEAFNFHWNLLCSASFTHSDVINSSPNIKSLAFLSQNLSYADVGRFRFCQYLNLSSNHLKFVNGLESLKLLKCCDLSNNPDLNLKATLNQLAALNSLTHVNLSLNHRGDFNKQENFNKILFSLFPNNSRLSCINGKLIDVNDYITVTKKSAATALDEEIITEYRWALTLTLDYYRIMKLQALTAKKDVTLTLAIPPSVHYTREKIVDQIVLIAPKLREFYGFSLSLTDNFSLKSFSHLSYINLANNRLTTVLALHLTLLPALAYIDLRNNKIKDNSLVIAQLLNSLPVLKGICLLGNPCATQNKFRAKLIESTESLANIHCTLKIIDTAITVEERVQAYSHRITNDTSAHSSNNINENKHFDENSNSPQPRRGSLTKFSDRSHVMKIGQFRFLLSLQHNLPVGAQFHTVNELVLVDQKLTFIDCMGFPLLEKLFLGKNELTTLKQSGIETLIKLKVLDLRNNKLNNLTELIELTTKLKNLEFIGGKENKFKEGGKYRHHLMIGLIQTVGHNHALRFIDDIELGADELVNSLSEVSSVNAYERERWRFAEVIKQYIDLPSLIELDVSGCKLQCAEFARFPNLKKLIVNNNLFTDEGFEESGVSECLLLETLEINENQLKSMAKFATILTIAGTFKKLTNISMLGNPMTVKEDRPRRLFLSYYTELLELDFLLKTLNNETVTIEERVNAFVVSATRNEKQFNNDLKARHHRRGNSAMGSIDLGNTPTQRARKLSDQNDNQPLSPTGGAAVIVPPPPQRGSISVMSASYSSIASPYVVPMLSSPIISQSVQSPFTNPALLLSSSVHFTAEAARCHLTLSSMFKPEQNKSALKSLKLRSLNLMFVGGVNGINQFVNLRSLDLRNNDLESLEHQGLETLINLHTLDLRGNKIINLNSIISALHKCHQLEILAIHKCTRTDETNIIDRYLDTVFSNLRGLSLCDGYKTNISLQSSSLSLSALNLLNKLNGIGPNELHEVHLTDLQGKKELLPFVLSALYHLAVTRLRLDGDNEWCALPEYTDLVIILMGKHLIWFDGTNIGEDRRYLALQVNEKKKLDKQRLVWEDVWEESHDKIDAFLLNKSLNKNDNKNRTLQSKSNKGAFFNANIPQTLNVSNGGASILSMSTTALSSILSKLEIVVHFIQIQSINLSIDLNIPWPKLYIDYSSFTNWFTVNIYNMVDINTEFAHILLFSLLISLPLLLLFFFYWFHSLRMKQIYYAKQLIQQWTQTKLIAFFLYLVALFISFIVGLFAAGNGQGLNNLMNGAPLNSESLTVILILGSSLTVIFAVWLIIVKVFRYYYMKDTTEDKLVFRSRWLSILNWGQIIIMFILTVSFMPISRIILQQFTCNAGDENCFPSSITAIQILSFLFGLVYIIGLPLFYIRLINRTVKLVLSTSRIYQMNEEKLVTMKNENIEYIKQLKKDSHSMSSGQIKKKLKEKEMYQKNYSLTMKSLHQQQYSLYYSIVNQPENQVPASSLYASFTRKYRFWKILQMAQKLFLILIALFIPAIWGELTNAKVVSSGTIIGLSAFIVIACRPYNDRLEDLMDGMAGIANTINAGVAIGLSFNVGWLSDGTSDIILLVANGATLLAFLIAFVFVPARALWHAKQGKAKELEEEKKLEEERKIREAKKLLREKQKEKKPNFANIKNAGNGGVKPVTEEEFARINSQQQNRSARGPSDGNPAPIKTVAAAPSQSLQSPKLSPSTNRRELASSSLSFTPSQRHRRVSSMQLPIIDERINPSNNNNHSNIYNNENSPSPLLNEPKSPVFESMIINNQTDDSMRRRHPSHSRAHSFDKQSPRLASRSHGGSLSISPSEHLSPVARQFAMRAMEEERKSSQRH